jgi:hypothetical protein
MNNKKKIVAIAGTLGVAAVAVAGASLALFTDKTDGNIDGTAGTIDIRLDDLDLSNPDNINPGDSDPDMPKTYVPTEGDPLFDPANPNKEVEISTTEHALTFTITNDGTKSMRTRHTLVVSVKDTQGNYLNADVFSLYEDSKELTGKSYIGADDKEYASVAEVPADVTIKAVKYVFTPDVFDGFGLQAEKEDASTVKSGDKAASKDYTYILAMDKDAKNEYQGAVVMVETLFEGMQFRNTVQDDWKVVSTETFDMTVATTSTQAAPTR